jgi:hypothetical protein
MAEAPKSKARKSRRLGGRARPRKATGVHIKAAV